MKLNRPLKKWAKHGTEKTVTGKVVGQRIAKETPGYDVTVLELQKGYAFVIDPSSGNYPSLDVVVEDLCRLLPKWRYGKR